MRRQDVREWKIAVIGAGTMGLCIAQLFAMHGHEVNLYNRTPANLDKAMLRIQDNLKTLKALGQTTVEENKQIFSRIHGSSDLKASLQDVDMLIENIAEQVEIKRQIFAQFDEFCDSDVIFASDTSTMNIYEFLEVSHPERLIITHFFNPAYVMPLTEVVRGPHTSDETVKVVRSLLESAGKTVAVLKKVVPGFILNRITTTILRECCYLVEQGVADFEDIDNALVSIYGSRFAFEGPFRLGDFVGLDIYARLDTLLPPVLCNSTECSPILTKMVEEGRLGLKTGGNGFYKYDNPSEAHRIRDEKYIKMLSAIKKVNEEYEK